MRRVLRYAGLLAIVALAIWLTWPLFVRDFNMMLERLR